ncbi:hypothetical protein BKA62DRAFT_777117 [Auriculariales sp. MPI-PUGE-AT-0066]|nr:hypothetical protein BKA62DRAFT_777117 [Auriculariales sp. MPI-PUGE-AT-0066]
MKFTGVQALGFILTSLSATMAAPQHSPQVQLVVDFLGTFVSADSSALSELLTEDFLYIPLPRSLNQPQRNKADFVTFVQGFRSNFVTIESHVNQTTEQPGRVVTFIEATGATVDGRNYNNQVMLTTDIQSVAGKLKISGAREFFDSLYTSQFLAGGQ